MSTYKKRTICPRGVAVQQGFTKRAKAVGLSFIAFCNQVESRLKEAGSAAPLDLRMHVNLWRYGLPEKVVFAELIYLTHQLRAEVAGNGTFDKIAALDAFEQELRQKNVLEGAKAVQYFIAIERLLLELEAAKVA